MGNKIDTKIQVKINGIELIMEIDSRTDVNIIDSKG